MNIIGNESSILPTVVAPVGSNRLGSIPRGFDGRPVMRWIEDGRVGQVDNPCASIQAQIGLLNTALAQTKIDAKNAADAGDEEALQQIAAAQAQINSQLSSLKSQLATCKKLTPGCTAPDGSTTPECPSGQICVGGKCVQPGTPVPPPCSPTNPCPPGQQCVNGTCVSVTAKAKPQSRGWLLLAVGALGTLVWAFKGG